MNTINRISTLLTIFILTIVLSACGTNKTAVTTTTEDIEANKIKEVNKEVVQQAQQNIIKNVRAIDKTDHFKGDLKSPVQIIIYSDFECPFSAGFKDTTDEVLKNFGDKVVIAYRHYPLRSHPMALSAALASECADEQGKFWEMHDKIFKENKDNKLTIEQIIMDANDLRIDMIKFQQCLDAEKYKDKIQAQMLEAINFGVSGTPGVFVNGEVLPGAYPYEDFTGEDGKQYQGMRSVIARHLTETK